MGLNSVFKGLKNWTDEMLNDISETEAQIMSASHFVTVLGVSGSY
jgi:hypothetical protein